MIGQYRALCGDVCPIFLCLTTGELLKRGSKRGGVSDSFGRVKTIVYRNIMQSHPQALLSPSWMGLFACRQGCKCRFSGDQINGVFCYDHHNEEALLLKTICIGRMKIFKLIFKTNF